MFYLGGDERRLRRGEPPTRLHGARGPGPTPASCPALLGPRWPSATASRASPNSTSRRASASVYGSPVCAILPLVWSVDWKTPFPGEGEVSRGGSHPTQTTALLLPGAHGLSSASRVASAPSRALGFRKQEASGLGWGLPPVCRGDSGSWAPTLPAWGE